ncbi:hypothetical protein B0H63DRAFT_488430, partial [Podospora didyma]
MEHMAGMPKPLDLDFDCNMLDLTSFNPSPVNIGHPLAPSLHLSAVPGGDISQQHFGLENLSSGKQGHYDTNKLYSNDGAYPLPCIPGCLDAVFNDHQMFNFDPSPLKEDMMFAMSVPNSMHNPSTDSHFTLTPPPSMLADHETDTESTMLPVTQPPTEIETPTTPNMSLLKTTGYGVQHPPTPAEMASPDMTIQKLFTLNSTIYTLASETSQLPGHKDQQQQQEQSFRCEDYPVDGILNATQTLLDILDFFVPSACSPRASDFGMQTRPQTPSDSFDPSPIDMRCNSSHFQQSDTPPPRPDIHTIMVIISCYTRLMRVYSNLIQDMHENFGHPQMQQQQQPQSNNNMSGRKGSLPGLKLGKIEIQQDSSQRALLLVQVGMHMIERIERLLTTLLNPSFGSDIYFQQGGSGGLRTPQSGIGVGIGLGISGLDPSFMGGLAGTGLFTGSLDQVAGSGNLQSILDMALQHDEYESQMMGRRGIGSLRGDICFLEQLLSRADFLGL